MTASTRINAHTELLARAGRILERLAHPRRARVLEVVAPLTGSLAEVTPTLARAPRSALTDDGTPFEFSLRLDRAETRFRLLWEAQASGSSPSPAALWGAGELVNRRARELPGVDMTLLDRVRDLFEPRPGASAAFAMWHALSFDGDGRFLLKIYMNPAIAGRPLATTILALERLGHGELAELVAGLACRRPRTSVRYFSIDLAAPEAARTKVYLAHAGIRLAELEDELSQVPGHVRGAVTAAIGRLSAHAGAFDDLPILSCIAARPGQADPSLTIHFPVRRYTAGDREALDRLARFLPAPQRALLERVLTDDLGMAAGDVRRFVSYVSMRAGEAAAEPTVYLQPHLLAARSLAPTARNTGT